MKRFAELHDGAGEATPATDDTWAERRLLAAELRKLQELLLCSDGDADIYRTACESLKTARSRLESLPRKAGLLAHTGTQGVTRFVSVAHETNPLYGRANPLAPPLDMWRDPQKAYGRARLNYAYEGPPNHAHGGFVAALFDQFLGFAQTLSGSSGMTGKLEIRYVLPTPLDTDLDFEGWIREKIGRLTYVEGKVSANGRITAKAKAMFIEVPPGYLSR